MTDLVTRLRALADSCGLAQQDNPDSLAAAIREAADALERQQRALKAKLAEAEKRIARRAEHPSNAEKLADRVRIYKGKVRAPKGARRES